MHALIKTCGILIVSRELSDARGRVVRETPAPWCRAGMRVRVVCARAPRARPARDLAPSRESQTRADGDRAQRSAERGHAAADAGRGCDVSRRPVEIVPARSAAYDGIV